MRRTAIIVITLALSSQLSFAEGLGTLIEVARSQGEIQKAYSEETKNFERAKENIDDGTIQKGLPKDRIKRLCGEPVVSLRDSETGREKWVYKPAKSDFFKGVKIHIFFDKNNNVDEITVVGEEAAKEEGQK